MASKVDYGLDAPLVVRNLFLGGFAALGVSFVPDLGGFVWSALSFFLAGVLMIVNSKFIKVRMREALLSPLAWRGDERVLDVGCGRGLMLLGAAARLQTGGRAVGIDLWQTEDLSGNSRDATLANARALGVEDRVDLLDGDARKLAFEDESFDVVLSCQALHNIYDNDERAQAVREIARVVKPGGRVIIVDWRRTRQYAQVLRAIGFDVVGPSFSIWCGFPPSPTVRATKPGKT